MNKRKGSNVSSIKLHNRSLVLHTIRKTGGISRADLAVATGLTRGGITPIIAELIDMGLIVEGGIIQTDSGRKPVLLQLNPAACCVVSVDLRRTGFSVARVDFCCNIEVLREHNLSENVEPQVMIPLIEKYIAELLDGCEIRNVLGIAISAPGPLDPKRGIILSPPNFTGWMDVPIVSLMSRRFNVPVFLDNNANASAVAERDLGNGHLYRNFIYLMVDDGIGAGIIIDGEVFRGHMGMGSEIGHVTVDINGRPCPCGNIGCLEMYAAIPKMLKNAFKTLKNGSISMISDEVLHKGYISWEDVLTGLKKSDGFCIDILCNEAQYLAAALVSSINVLQPEAVFIGGQLALAEDHILKPLKELIAARSITRKFHIPDIHISRINRAALLGSASSMIAAFIDGHLNE